MVGDEPHLPYDRPPLSKQFLQACSGDEPHRLRSDEVWDSLNVDLHTGTTAVGLDAVNQRVHTSDGSIDFDAVVIATGATARTLDLFGGVDGVHQLRTHDDALRIRAALGTARHLVVVGGGFIGSEVAAAASTRGIDVTLVSASDRLLGRSVGPMAAQMLLALHHDAGVHTVLGARPVDIDVRDGRLRGVTLDSGRHLAADAVVVGVGARPSSDWMVGSGIDIDPHSRAIRCDRSLATNVAQVWAAGDVASVPGQPGGHWTAAMESGFIAGANVAGAGKEFTSVPFAWSNWFGHRIQIVGDTRSAQERRDDDGLVVYGHRDRIVGAVGVDSPGAVARVRREMGRRAKHAALATFEG